MILRDDYQFQRHCVLLRTGDSGRIIYNKRGIVTFLYSDNQFMELEPYI